MHGTPLIVGLDPGTTTGIAVLDLDGNLIYTKSRKNFSRSEVSKYLSGLGSPVIITGDTRPLPRMVEKMASTFSASLEVPEQSLSRLEKKRILKSFFRRNPGIEKPNNRHERDALASALHAWKGVRELVAKVNKKLEDRDSPELGDYVKSNVIVKGENISSSIGRFLNSKS